ncbi:Branchpoint-bridging protein [Clydaea vesicula]|uniref:Branchpoint-bridging protein n=1 Tax=Clydaea vesicula TaxID=447962 RepID=A0AAD5U0E8_9FUNG|nr:Branchpoint-bridging protein [Clydaea vesicula]
MNNPNNPNLVPLVPRKRANQGNNDNQLTEVKKRKSRWGDSEKKTIMPGLPTTIPTGLTSEQYDAYVMKVRIEEITCKLRTGDVLPVEIEGRPRSISPEPIYGPDGKRVNMRTQRYAKKLEDERHKLVEMASKKIPGFLPPSDYKKPTKTSERLYIPANDFPEINFIGLLIGPRGNTLKKLEADSGAKISIRGKGSVKEGKSGVTPGEDEELHCLIMADSEVKVKKAIAAVNKIIETAASVPEGQNELKRLQLRELASLNGTLRDEDALLCTNCGDAGHRSFDCPETSNVTINVVCKICGGAGHIASDCLEKNNPEALRAAEQRNLEMDTKYATLMNQIGEEQAATAPGSAAAPWASAGASAAPWATTSVGALPPGISFTQSQVPFNAMPGIPFPPPMPFGGGVPGFVPPPPPPSFDAAPQPLPPDEDVPPPPEEE